MSCDISWGGEREREREREVAQLCPTLCDSMDCSLPGSSVHGIFQVRVLEWGAIAFSGVTGIDALYTIFLGKMEAHMYITIIRTFSY